MSARNALSQYLELYDQHRALVDQHGVPALNRLRPEAEKALTDAKLDKRLERIFSPDLGVNVTRVPFNADVATAFKCDVPNISTLLGIFANDIFRPSEALLRRCPDGVTVGTFANNPELADRYCGTVQARVMGKRHPAAQLNSLLAADGLVIHVAKGVRCGKAIQLVNILGGTTTPVLALRRLLIVVDDDASIDVLSCDHTMRTAGTATGNASNTVVEVILGRNAILNYHDVEEADDTTGRYCALCATLQTGARLNAGFATLRCGTTVNDVAVDLLGEHADCRINGMAITDGQQQADNRVRMHHQAPHCHSDQLFKYVADGASDNSFDGLIYVAEGAHHTEAYQSNRNILASDQARMLTQPQLEIYCDDVKCSHGTATGQLDEQQLFYMRTRGIPLAQARTMLMQAFMADVIDAITLQPLRDRMRYLVERRVTGVHAACKEA